ncbi:MAG: T9SS type A sorting domain-containing protein [Melioribacter sp.]|nr:T9SS type A sorting domain-containing protein [Melioribacter sp.]
MKNFLPLSLIVLIFGVTALISRDFRVSKIPNGNKFSCGNCHVSSLGGARNAFGRAVEARVTFGGNQDFWDSQLASLDSDGDGFSNGVELQDPNGTWRPGQPNPGNPNLVSNPGDPNSKPTTSHVESSFYPYTYKLLDNYPNPFNPETRIVFEIPREEHVSLMIFDVNGKLIKELVNENLSSGRYEKLWDGKDDENNEVVSGIYFYQLKAGHFEQTKKMILLK